MHPAPGPHAWQFSRKALTSLRFGRTVKFFNFKHINAQVAELVDALVSNTSDSNIVPVRSRPWALSSNDVRVYYNQWR